MTLRLTDERRFAIETGIDFRGRRIWLHSGVEEEIIARVTTAIYLMDAASEDPVTLYVSSYGGDLDEAFGLHDVTRTVKSEVHTVALGKCMSAAPLLVACGHPGERCAAPNTTFMLHDCEIAPPEGSPRALKAHVEAAESAMGRLAELLERYSSKPKRHWATLFRRKDDVFFDAYQARDWGLVDYVWSEKDSD